MSLSKVVTMATTTNSTPPTGARKRPAPRRLSLQPRDLEIVHAVYAHRVLTSAQIGALFFPGAASEATSACRTRLRLLVAAGLLARLEQPVTRAEGRRPFLYMPTEAGCRLLVEELGIDPHDLEWKPSYNRVGWPFLAHQLAINDLYITVTRGCALRGWTLDTWIDDRILRKTHTAHPQTAGAAAGVVVPDAYFTVQTPAGIFRLFAEIDRATMAVAPTSLSTKSWERRIEGYQAFFASPAIMEMYGTTSIRVLTVTTGERRLTHLKEAIEAVGGQKRYWLATFSDITPEAVFTSPIWHVATVTGRRALLA